MSTEVHRPEPNTDLIKFFGHVTATFEFGGLEVKLIPLTIAEFERQQRIYYEARQAASEDKLLMLAEQLGQESEALGDALGITDLMLYDPNRKTGFEPGLVWLQWCLGNRGIDITMDELKFRVGFDAVETFTDALTPPRRKGSADDPKA